MDVTDLVWNERIKLLANLLNTCAGSCITLWLLAPLAAYVYTGPQSAVSMWALVAGAPVGVASASVLHLAARRVLRRLR